MNGARRFQLFPAWTDIEIAILFAGEVGTVEFAVRRHFASIPHRNVRSMSRLTNQPSISPAP
jgi:hypothetical protein